jgi:O-methyltransferase
MIVGCEKKWRRILKVSSIKRISKACFNLLGLNVSLKNRSPSDSRHFHNLYRKYKDRSMLGRNEYVKNLASSVTASGCVVECGVWKGGTSAGMAEILGADREYFLFDSFQGHVDPQPIDGPAAVAWKVEKDGPWYFNNAVVGPEEADAAMRLSGAKQYRLIQGWFNDTLPRFEPPCPIAVLRVDCDWYEGAMICLRSLFPHLAEDGIFIADGYPDWDGYARAVHEYLAEYDGVARIKLFQDSLYYVTKGARDWKTATIGSSPNDLKPRRLSARLIGRAPR